MAEPKPDDVSIGKFDILATYTYAKALLDGLDDDESREWGDAARPAASHHGKRQDSSSGRSLPATALFDRLIEG